MREIEKNIYVLNKLDNKLYKYIEYRECSFSHVLLDENDDEISFFKSTKELLVDNDDIVVDLQEMLEHLNNVIKLKEKENKRYRKDIENPMDRGKALSLKNTLVTEIYNIKRSMTRNKLSIEEEFSLSNKLIEKENALHIIELKLSHSIFVDYANLEIEKNNEIIKVCKNSLSFVKKMIKESKKEKKEKNMNELIINLEKIIIDDMCHYKVVEENQFDLTNDLYSIVNYNGEPIAVIVFASMVDNGDYNYDDEYEPNYCEEYSYRRIFFSPLSGKKIVFNIVRESNETERYLEMKNIIDKYAHRKRFSKDEKIVFNRAKCIINEINNGLLEVIYDCIE